MKPNHETTTHPAVIRAILRSAPHVVDAMRAWAADCEWADDVSTLSDSAIVHGVDRHYVGGAVQFLLDMEPRS